LAEVSHVCLNDDVVEGLRLIDEEGRLKAFSVQYHPEAAAGPHDAGYLFDRFVDLMRSANHHDGFEQPQVQVQATTTTSSRGEG
jgi:carbamoyl-phosphate synthase small subunit